MKIKTNIKDKSVKKMTKDELLFEIMRLRKVTHFFKFKYKNQKETINMIKNRFSITRVFIAKQQQRNRKQESNVINKLFFED